MFHESETFQFNKSKRLEFNLGHFEPTELIFYNFEAISFYYIERFHFNKTFTYARMVSTIVFRFY